MLTLYRGNTKMKVQAIAVVALCLVLSSYAKQIPMSPNDAKQVNEMAAKLDASLGGALKELLSDKEPTMEELKEIQTMADTCEKDSCSCITAVVLQSLNRRLREFGAKKPF